MKKIFHHSKYTFTNISFISFLTRVQAQTKRHLLRFFQLEAMLRLLKFVTSTKHVSHRRQVQKLSVGSFIPGCACGGIGGHSSPFYPVLGAANQISYPSFPVLTWVSPFRPYLSFFWEDSQSLTYGYRV